MKISNDFSMDKSNFQKFQVFKCPPSPSFQNLTLSLCSLGPPLLQGTIQVDFKCCFQFYELAIQINLTEYFPGSIYFNVYLFY